MSTFIPLNEVIKLENLNDEIRSQYKSRPLSKQHINNLLQVEADDLPPVTVMKTEKGYAVVDGAHRIERARIKGEVQIRADFAEYNSENDLIMKAYMSNQGHGLPEKVSRRVDFALWLIVSHGMSVREAAAVAKVNPSTIVKRKQHNREQATEEKPIEDENLKPLKRLFKAIEGLRDYDDTNMCEDIRECLGGGFEAVEDIQGCIRDLVENFLYIVKTV